MLKNKPKNVYWKIVKIPVWMSLSLTFHSLRHTFGFQKVYHCHMIIVIYHRFCIHGTQKINKTHLLTVIENFSAPYVVRLNDQTLEY